MCFDSANLQGREQYGKGREAGDKGTGSGRAGYGRREVLTPLSPPSPPPPQLNQCLIRGQTFIFVMHAFYSLALAE